MSSTSSSEDILSKADRWDKRFMGLCDHLASWSEEKGRKVGCVIVGDGNTIISMGYNGLPRGVSGDHENRHDRVSGEKYLWYEHAERNAIYNAARIGASLANSTMYVNLFPCADCGRAIIQSGISELVTRRRPESDLRFGASMDVSLQMIREAGVKIRYV